MMKYPIGVQSFEKIIQEGYVYVDKTELIYKLIKGGTIYFLTLTMRHPTRVCLVQWPPAMA